MKRDLKLSKFRNFGLKNEETLCLNSFLDKNNIGGLIILIGANNSGKSNILDALVELGTRERLSSEKDITYLSYKEEDQNPLLTIQITDDNIDASYSISLNDDKYLLKNKKITNIPKKEIISNLENILSIGEKHNINLIKIKELKNNIDQKNSNISTQEMITIINEFLDFIWEKNKNNYSDYRIFLDDCKDITLVKNFTESKNINCKDKINNYLNEKYGLNLKPKIIKYIEKNINAHDMKTSYNSLDDNNFFMSIFKLIDFDKEEILKAYDNFYKYNNASILNNIENKINEKLKIVNEQFNKLYYSESDEYIFSIKLESEKILFGLTRGKLKTPTMIDTQSTGFRWFFNFYFNFVSNNSLTYGDIIIMDEPATNLHPAGQRELRNFIKEFSKKNGLTFIIATHSPFFIDVDNFDELKLISSENHISHIENSFTAVDLKDPDTLLPIKKSLTIEQNVLYDIDTEVIWVEGITDYNYLTMFKKILSINNIAFLPFNGVGKNDEDQLKIIEKLNNIKFYKRNILVDGDAAGKRMLKNCKDTSFDKIVSISDISSSNDKKFIEIEDLFSVSDKDKFECLNKSSKYYKKSFFSSMVKNYCTKSDFSKETINNFKTLFNKLLDN